MTIKTTDRIRALMARTGMDATDTAEYLGVPYNTLRNWLAGEREPSQVVSRLVEVLGIVEALAPGLHREFVPAPRVDGRTTRHAREEIA